jgi:hypothetical protein
MWNVDAKYKAYLWRYASVIWAVRNTPLLAGVPMILSDRLGLLRIIDFETTIDF